MTSKETKSVLTAAAVAALLSWAGGGAAAEALSAPDAAIKDLLAAKAGGAVCFGGKFSGLRVNVWEYAKGKEIPVPGVFQGGKQVTRVEPAIQLDQEVVELEIMLDHTDLQDKSWDAMHMFCLEVTLKDWPKLLRSSGECPWRMTARPLPGFPDSYPATITSLVCGVDEDGGGFRVRRAPGSGAVILRFEPESGGLRMTASGGEIHLGGVREVNQSNDPNFRPTEFRLKPTPVKACRTFRRAARKW